MKSRIPAATITAAVHAIRNGGVVLYPTDTVYGLGCDPLNVAALRRLIAIKGRAESKGLIVLVHSWEDLRRVAKPTAGELRLARQYWPGPLTIIFDAKPGVPRLLTGGRKTIAVRWPRDPFLERLLKQLKAPLVSTSANVSGEPSTTSFRKARRAFRGKKFQADLNIDGGTLPERQPSTIVRRNGKGFRVIRQGDIQIT